MIQPLLTSCRDVLGGGRASILSAETELAMSSTKHTSELWHLRLSYSRVIAANCPLDPQVIVVARTQLDEDLTDREKARVVPLTTMVELDLI